MSNFFYKTAKGNIKPPPPKNERNSNDERNKFLSDNYSEPVRFDEPEITNKRSNVSPVKKKIELPVITELSSEDDVVITETKELSKQEIYDVLNEKEEKSENLLFEEIPFKIAQVILRNSGNISIKLSCTQGQLTALSSIRSVNAQNNKLPSISFFINETMYKANVTITEQSRIEIKLLI